MIQYFVQESASGFLVGSSVTWADLLIAEQVQLITEAEPGFLDGYPEVRLEWKVQIEKVPIRMDMSHGNLNKVC